MRVSGEGKFGILIGLVSIAGAGAIMLAPDRPWIGWGASALFHLMAGTSTGGILGCGLAKGKPAREIAELYAKRGGEIFHRSLWEKVTTIDGLSNPVYDPTPLETILEEELGDTWLSESSGAELMVPSYAIQLPFQIPGDGLGLLVPRAPYFFKTWKAKGTALDPGDNPPELDFKLKDIARATSAAPTYFPPALSQEFDRLRSRSCRRFRRIGY